MVKTVITIRVTVESVKYPRGEVSATPPYFVIFTGRTESGESVTAKGEMPAVPIGGLRLTLTGVWSAWQGQRFFKFYSAAEDLPVDERGMLRYACELTTGFGAATEEKIWAVRGEDWRNLHSGEVAGITEAKIAKFHETIERLKLESEKAAVIVWLTDIGCTMSMANKAWDKWKAETTAVLRGNCYLLAWLDGISFNDVDGRIRRSFGIGDTDVRRLKAAVDYCMKLLTASGSSLVKWPVLWIELQRKLPNVPQSAITGQVARMFGDSLVSFGAESGLIARMSDFMDERTIWEFTDKACVVNVEGNAEGKQADK